MNTFSFNIAFEKEERVFEPILHVKYVFVMGKCYTVFENLKNSSLFLAQLKVLVLEKYVQQF